MNLIDLVVTEVRTEPFEHYDKWWVKVEAEGYGRQSRHTLMFETKEQAEKVKIGYVFQA